MPVYTYRCEACGFVFDQRLGFHDPHPTRCPECGAEALHRVYKPVGIVFKGSGFYATDHRSPSGTSGNGHKNGQDASKPANHTAKEASKSAAKEASKTPEKAG